jgi:predicted  nucleic acid-binding Zn-ribbon protein
MSKLDESFDDLVQRLKTERDELRVKAHLAKLEAEQEWQSMESKWADLEQRIEQIGDEAKETGESFVEASERLARDLAEAFRNFRRNLK